MNTRNAILSRIRSGKPSALPLPEITLAPTPARWSDFETALTFAGGKMISLQNLGELKTHILKAFPNSMYASTLIKSPIVVDPTSDKSILNSIDLAVLEGEFGVSENGAIWLPEKNMMNRALPFIAQHLILVVQRKNIVSTMNEAYAKLSTLVNYGVFISGPSKTADIEQSLVIGAHGPRSMTIALIGTEKDE